MKLIKLKLFFIALTILYLLCGSVSAQQNLEFLSYKLPKEDKKILIESIDSLTEKMRGKKWSEVYDLLSNKLKENWDSKENFIHWQKDDKGYFVTDFKVNRDSILVENNEKFQESVHLTGCISVIEEGKKMKYLGTIEAERNGTEKWFFNSLPIVNPNYLIGGPRHC